MEQGISLVDRIKRTVRKRPAVYLAVAALLIFFVGMLAASLFIMSGKLEIASVDNSGAPGFDKGQVEDYTQENDGKEGKDANAGIGAAQTAEIDSSVVFDVDKIIYNGTISLNTDDYQGTLSKIQDYTRKMGGFIQDATSFYMDEMQNRDSNSGSITIRIPAAKFQEAMQELQKYGMPLNASINSTNISQQYQDIAGQLENLKIQEDRLLEYLKKAEKIQDMLSIESELNRVRTEIDYRTTIIKNWDVQVAYSTIYLSVYEQKLATTEVKSPFDDMLGKIKESFISSINFLLYLASQAIIWFFKLLPFAVILAAVYFIFARFWKKKTL